MTECTNQDLKFKDDLRINYYYCCILAYENVINIIMCFSNFIKKI